jgi:aquaporin Z
LNYLNDNRLRAEVFGTACLILFGCGSAVLTGFSVQLPMGFLAISITFGFAVVAMAYALGPVSGCHLNPAVTAAIWSAGRMKGEDAIAYVIAQLIGGIIGALILYLIVKGRVTGWDPATQGLGQNGWSQYSMVSAIIAEFVATLIFTLVILAVTGPRGTPAMAGLAIGITLMLMHLAFIFVSGAGFNPARSLGPALFTGGNALVQLPMYLIVPTVAGLLGGWLVKSKTLDF